jgi:hypothetical protein
MRDYYIYFHDPREVNILEQIAKCYKKRKEKKKLTLGRLALVAGT